MIKNNKGHNIFRTILDRKIDIFISTFGIDSDSIFKNRQGQLNHPGEYGAYRERCFMDLLRTVTDTKSRVSDGFIINSEGETGTQCDIIVYVSELTPLISEGVAKFFPIEAIKAIGEVKSTLSKRDFAAALKKMAKNKRLCRTMKRECIKEHLNPFSFLVCKKLSFNTHDINFDEIYEGIDRMFWHNAILSLEDGVITYSFDMKNYPAESKPKFEKAGIKLDSGPFIHPYPFHAFGNYKNEIEILNCSQNIIIPNKVEPLNHIISFIAELTNCLPRVDTQYVDYILYYGLRAIDIIKRD